MSRCRLPFHALIIPLPPLPVEIWEYIIDCLGFEYQRRIDRPPHQETLHACGLVCHAWRNRSRIHLYANVLLEDIHIPSFQKTIRISQKLISLTTRRIWISNIHQRPVSSLFIRNKLDNLSELGIESLDLSREHSMLPRAPLSRSVHHLTLVGLQKSTVSQLIHFINSFHSLATLHIHLVRESMRFEHKGEILPKPQLNPSRSLTSARLPVVPCLDKVVGWYIREGTFFANLQELTLDWPDYPKGSEPSSYFGGVKALLGHCVSSIRSLTMTFGRVPMIEEVFEVCTSPQPALRAG